MWTLVWPSFDLADDLDPKTEWHWTWLTLSDSLTVSNYGHLRSNSRRAAKKLYRIILRNFRTNDFLSNQVHFVLLKKMLIYEFLNELESKVIYHDSFSRIFTLNFEVQSVLKIYFE